MEVEEGVGVGKEGEGGEEEGKDRARSEGGKCAGRDVIEKKMIYLCIVVYNVCL